MYHLVYCESGERIQVIINPELIFPYLELQRIQIPSSNNDLKSLYGNLQLIQDVGLVWANGYLYKQSKFFSILSIDHIHCSNQSICHCNVAIWQKGWVWKAENAPVSRKCHQETIYITTCPSLFIPNNAIRHIYTHAGTWGHGKPFYGGISS